MNRRAAGLLVLILPVVSAVALVRDATSIRPLASGSTLEVGSQTLHPVATADVPPRMFDTATHRLGVDGATVTIAPRAGTGAVLTAKADDGRRVIVFAATSNTAFLVGYETNVQGGGFSDYEHPPRLRRLSLTTGAWLPDLSLSAGPAARRVLAVLADGEGAAVLTCRAKGDFNAYEEKVTGYGVLYFEPGSNQAKWVRSLPAEGAPMGEDAWLWNRPIPGRADPFPRRLAWMGDRLLVTPDATEPIRCLSQETGTVLWTLDRPWEFERGFVGPSVWSHYIGRFGEDPDLAPKAGNADARKAFERQSTCAIVGGPVVVRLAHARDNDAYSIFVATRRGPAALWSRNISDCTIREFSDAGQPVSMAPLPQMVEAGNLAIQQDGLVWPCQNDTFVKIEPATDSPKPSFCSSKSDGMSRVTWLRQLPEVEHAAWLRAASEGKPVAFNATHAFVVREGGFIRRKNEQVYRFPLCAVDLATGLATEMTLCVPFAGLAKVPASNFSSTRTPEGTTVFQLCTSLGFAVVDLRVLGERLEIVLGTDKAPDRAILFDLAGVLEPRPVAPVDPMETARARVRALSSTNLSSVLRNAVHTEGADFVRALLEAGADPRYAEIGWNALMVAAAYGSAEVVDVLIAAGSDINARDGNCGGQTVLMWAARSGRESSRKVKALLKAGADAKAVTDNGCTALELAAERRDTAVVELLRAAVRASP